MKEKHPEVPLDTKTTELYSLHKEYGGKLVSFSGYYLPLYYKAGMVKEHIHTRQLAGLFDVSHMGQILVTSPKGSQYTLSLLEKLTPSPLSSLDVGSCQYTVLTGKNGGCLDDFLVEHLDTDKVLAVVNASRKDFDLSYLKKHLPELTFNLLDSFSLLALQGPKAAALLNSLIPGVIELKFMQGSYFSWQGNTVWITRSGYTGEDGFEISLSNNVAEEFSKSLLSFDEICLIGLGARDSLRLEAGLPLYGHELDVDTSFIEASMKWLVGKPTPKKLVCPGNLFLNRQLKDPLSIGKRRVGIIVEEKSIPREGYEILSEEKLPIGTVTSGAYSPSLKKPLGQAYVKSPFAKAGTKVYVVIRGKCVGAEVVKLPFLKPRYIR